MNVLMQVLSFHWFFLNYIFTTDKVEQRVLTPDIVSTFWLDNHWQMIPQKQYTVGSRLGVLSDPRSYVCRRRWLGGGRILAHRPRSSIPLYCSDTSDIHRCCDRNYPQHGCQCGHYIGRACRVAAHQRPLQGHHKIPPDRRHSEDLRGKTDTVWSFCWDFIISNLRIF